MAQMIQKGKVTWTSIWEAKGRQKTDDLMAKAGYDGEDVHHEFTAPQILKCINFQQNESIFEVGTGPNSLGQHLKGIEYMGCDKAQSMVDAHNKNAGQKSCIKAEANSLPIADNSWDHVIVQGVMHYCDNEKYADESIKEAERVARKTVLFSDLRRQGRQHKEKTGFELFNDDNEGLKHCTFSTDYFTKRGYQIIEAFYDPSYGEPFCALKKIE